MTKLLLIPICYNIEISLKVQYLMILVNISNTPTPHPHHLHPRHLWQEDQGAVSVLIWEVRLDSVFVFLSVFVSVLVEGIGFSAHLRSDICRFEDLITESNTNSCQNLQKWNLSAVKSEVGAARSFFPAVAFILPPAKAKVMSAEPSRVSRSLSDIQHQSPNLD